MATVQSTNAEWLKQKFIVSESWRLAVQDQGVSRAERQNLCQTSPLAFSGLQAIFGVLWPWLHRPISAIFTWYFPYTHRPVHPFHMNNSLIGLGTHCSDLCVCAVTQSCLTLCDPIDCNPPGSSVHGISQQEYWSG